MNDCGCFLFAQSFQASIEVLLSVTASPADEICSIFSTVRRVDTHGSAARWRGLVSAVVAKGLPLRKRLPIGRQPGGVFCLSAAWDGSEPAHAVCVPPPDITPLYFNLFALMRESDRTWFPPSHVFKASQAASESLQFRLR